MTEQPLLIGG